MKTKLSDAIMRPLAETLVSRFAPNCERIEIAGSLRRLKSEIGDIEIVAIPTPALYEQLDTLLTDGKIRHGQPKRWGQKLRTFLFDTIGGYTIQVDLFLQPDPATWGCNMMIRTGSQEFSKRMVTERSKGGFMPDGYQIREARVWRGDTALPTPDELDVFMLWGMACVEPWDRTADCKPVFNAQRAEVSALVAMETKPLSPIMHPDSLARIEAEYQEWLKARKEREDAR